jgi:hypothetical protein
MTCRTIALAGALTLLAATSFAQQPMTFRLETGDRNPSACAQADASMSRPQTVTIANDVATLKSNGGINDKARMVSPRIYRTRWSLSGVTFDIEVNTSGSPATLSVAEPKLGCRWSGKAA